MRAALDAAAADLNRRGGLFGRRLELAYASPAGAPAERLAALERFLAERRPFVLLAAFLPGIEAELDALAAREGIPVIGTFTLDPRVTDPPNPHVFHLAAGQSDQLRVLVRHEKPRATAATAVLHGGAHGALATVVVDACVSGGWPVVPKVVVPRPGGDPDLLAERLAATGTATLFYLGLGAPQDEAAFWTRAAELSWQPRVLGSGLLGRQGPPGRGAPT